MHKPPVEILSYDSNWVEQFSAEAKLIKPIFAENFIAIYHIGSTAVPGLAAKPIIDMMLEVKDIHLVDKCNDAMAGLSYEAWGEYNISGRRFFVKGKEKRTHHLHTFQTGSADITRHLCLRNYLIAHPQDASDYAALKIKLAKQFSDDREAYSLGKHDFVQALEIKALAWGSNKK